MFLINQKIILVNRTDLMKPNLIIPGAPKSATTYFYNILKNHPDIFFPPIKEPRYFISDSVLKISRNDPLSYFIKNNSVLSSEEFYKMYEDVKCKILGDASIQYMYHFFESIPKIKKELGHPRIIIFLRNPVERAISNWKYTVADQDDFSESLKKSETRVLNNYSSFWNYFDQGLYYKQVRAFLKNFDNVKVIIVEKYLNNDQKIIDEICSFLCVKKLKINDRTKVNSNKSFNLLAKNKLFKFFFKSRKFRSFLKKENFLSRYLSKCITREKKVDLETKRQMMKKYKEDILKLENLLDTDLSIWYDKYKFD